MLFALVLDMILPSNTFRKYTKLVVGLILVAILLTPIVKLFQQDFTFKLEEQLSAMSNQNKDIFVQKIENKKTEINHADRAYILEQMAVQLKKDAEGELMNKFQHAVVEVQIELKDMTKELKTENIQHIHVVLQKTSTGTVEKVEPVEISPGGAPKKESKKEGEIREWLEKRWGLKKQVVTTTIHT